MDQPEDPSPRMSLYTGLEAWLALRHSSQMHKQKP